MAITINNLVNDLEFVFSATEKQTYPKLGLRTKVKGDYVIITSFNGGFAPTGENAALRINWHDVTSPVVTSASTLAVAIQAFAATLSLGGGGASAGGGDNMYSNATGDFIATTTTGARTITVTGLPFTLEAKHVIGGWIKRVDSTGDVKNVVISNVVVSIGVVTVADETDVFAAGDTVIMAILGEDKAYDVNLDSKLVIVQNPNYAHTTSVETLVAESAFPGLTATTDDGAGDATNIIDATAAFTLAEISKVIGYRVYSVTDGTYGLVASWVSGTQITTSGGTVASWASDAFKIPVAKLYEVNMDTYNHISFHYRLVADLNTRYTLMIYGTLDATATVDALTNWVNLSSALLGAVGGIVADGILAGATATAEDIVIVDTPTPMLKYMVKLVAEGKAAAASGSSATVFIKKSS